MKMIAEIVKILKPCIMNILLNMISEELRAIIKKYVNKIRKYMNKGETLERLKEDSKINIQLNDTKITSDKLINCIAEDGDITIDKSNISGLKIKYQSNPDRTIEINPHTKSQTEETQISINEFGKAKIANGALMEQNEKGILLKA
ncbi:MAG: hypothetical protein WD055_03100 [Candidatus Dependentiae bacterium]